MSVPPDFSPVVVGGMSVTTVAASWVIAIFPLATLLVSVSVALFSPVSETSAEDAVTTGGVSGRLFTLTVMFAVSKSAPSLAVTVRTCSFAVS